MLREYDMPSYYYPEAINKAVALVKTYRKRLKKKQKATIPHVYRPMLATYYGFRISNGNLMIPIAARTYESIPLNAHTLKVISAVKVHSFALSAYTLSLSQLGERSILWNAPLQPVLIGTLEMLPSGMNSIMRYMISRRSLRSSSVTEARNHISTGVTKEYRKRLHQSMGRGRRTGRDRSYT
ncbi:MAG: hypothetical protein B2I17_01805, partial [Thermoplasmatales archaeon B_DKE]